MLIYVPKNAEIESTLLHGLGEGELQIQNGEAKVKVLSLNYYNPYEDT